MPRRGGAQNNNGIPRQAAQNGMAAGAGGGQGAQNPPRGGGRGGGGGGNGPQRGGGNAPQNGGFGRGRPPAQAQQPQAAQQAPPPRYPRLGVAVRGLLDFTTQDKCYLCFDDLASFARDNRDPTQYIFNRDGPAPIGMNFYYHVNIFPCGHYMCSHCFDNLRSGEGGDLMGIRDTLVLERCGLCTLGTGYYSPATDDQRDAIQYVQQAGGWGDRVARAMGGVNLLPLPVMPPPTIQQVAAANNVVIAPPANAANPLQRLNHAAAAGTLPATAVAAVAHRVLAAYSPPLSQLPCNGIYPQLTALRGVGNGSYHVDGGYEQLVDSHLGINDSGRHPVLHHQARAISKWFVEYVARLQQLPGGDRLIAIDVGGRPDKIQTFVQGGTATIGARIHHMCPIIMKEDYDRETKMDPWVKPNDGSDPIACRCRIGDASVEDVGGCDVCNPPGFKRIFFLCHVYALDANQLAMLCRSGDVILALHSFRGFKGEFVFNHGTTTDVVEATWERMGDQVEMNVEGGENYVHSSFNFLNSGRSMDCGPYGAFKWSKVATVGDYSVGSCPMGNTNSGTTIWYLSKCASCEVLPRPTNDFNRVNATREVEMCGTKYKFTRDGKVIQIIATGAITDSYTVSWEAFDAVMRPFVAQNPDTALTYGRSRAVVTTHIPADKTNLILCAARAFMRQGLVAYGDAVVADRTDAARISGQLRGTRESAEYKPAAFGAVLGFYVSRTPAGCFAGAALGLAATKHYRELCAEGLEAYLMRRNVSMTTALTVGAGAALIAQNAVSAVYNKALDNAPMIDPVIKGAVASVDIRSFFNESVVAYRPSVLDWQYIRDYWNKPYSLTVQQNASAQWVTAGTWWNTFIHWIPDAIRANRTPKDRPPDIRGCYMPVSSFGWFLDDTKALSRSLSVLADGVKIPFASACEVWESLSSGGRAIVMCSGVIALSSIMARRKDNSVDRRYRDSWTRWLPGSMLPEALLGRVPSMLADCTPFDSLRRAGYIGLRFGLQYLFPAQAQVILIGVAVMDAVEARWLTYNIAHVTCEEVVKGFWGNIMRHHGLPSCYGHRGFAFYEFVWKCFTRRNELTRPQLMLGAGLAALMHCAIADLPFTTREMIHTMWNLCVLAVPVVGSLIAGRSEIGRKVYDICDGMYDSALKHGNVLTGQGFLYDFKGWEANSDVAHEIREDGKFTPGEALRQVESKPKGMGIIGPLLSPDIRKFPAPVAHTPANEKRSIFKRVLMVTPCLDQTFFKSTFKPLYESVMRELFMDERVKPMPRVEWLATMPPRRRAMLEQAFRDIDGDPWLTKAHDTGGHKYDPTKRSLFLKVEQTEYDKDGRAIQAGRDTALAVAGPWCMALCKALRDCGNGERSYEGIRIIYGIGRDKTTCYRMFFKLAEQGEKVVMITGDDVLVTTGTHIYSIDAKRWDAHTLSEMLGLGNLQWLKMGCPKRAFENMEQGLNRNGRSTHGHKYERKGGTASGDPDTIQKNCVTGTPIIVMALLASLASGGDFAKILVEMARKVGVVYEFVDEEGVKVGDYANYHRCEFCSCYPIKLSDGTVGACPKLGKVFFRFGLCKLGHPPDVSLRSKALSLLAEARHSSVLTHYAETAYRCVGHGKVHLEDRRFTEYATIFDVDPDCHAEEELLRLRYGYGKEEIMNAVTEIWRDYVNGQVCFTNSIIASMIEVDN